MGRPVLWHCGRKRPSSSASHRPLLLPPQVRPHKGRAAKGPASPSTTPSSERAMGNVRLPPWWRAPNRETLLARSGRTPRGTPLFRGTTPCRRTPCRNAAGLTALCAVPPLARDANARRPVYDSALFRGGGPRTGRFTQAMIECTTSPAKTCTARAPGPQARNPRGPRGAARRRPACAKVPRRPLMVADTTSPRPCPTHCLRQHVRAHGSFESSPEQMQEILARP